MSNSVHINSNAVRGIQSPLAQIRIPHGYRFDGDRVELHAGFTVLNREADQRRWALQLWACPSVPASAAGLAGHLVAEVTLPPMSEIADATHSFALTTVATTPAQDGEFTMVLALASGQIGRFDEVHDIAAYPMAERFVQPRLRGQVGYRIDGERIRLSVERIENSRDAANLSGTLALELWALSEPYQGGAFQGFHLAGIALGSLAGQAEFSAVCHELPFAVPPAGRWNFVLMLREWTELGFVTRDFSEFASAVTYGPTPAAPPETAVEAVRPESPAALPEASGAVEEKAASVEAAADLPVSVNTATEAELARIEGLSPKLVRAIEKKRPFSSLDELKKIRGFSAKLLGRIRSRLKL